ncbi:hypothetical protein HHK36_014448 [Tetracentron sinense]|uniref:Uncharacterized protein n=1 Tax=Tetracentron sinense TaxID=13715 RepID=A0A834Z547_TETSI|nr:hypothetical protein HHK36_014448 [Tetracentron sinense]
MGVRGSKLSRMLRSGNNGVKRLKGCPIMTPRGYIPVSVGVNNETKRFMIHTTSLSDAGFLELLYRSAEEYGFSNQGILRIPYDPKDFEEWIMIRHTTQNMLRVKDPLAVFR